jgi:TPP-dependent indolepyruvate ferredoxin oxidoreductase alpha subunit
METLYNEDNKIYEKLNMNEQQFKKDLEKYRTLNIKIRKEFELQSNNNIEGMQNFKGSLNMNDINGMLSDSDLIVLQGNYSYIMWSILAVGLLTITVNTMKK